MNSRLLFCAFFLLNQVCPSWCWNSKKLSLFTTCEKYLKIPSNVCFIISLTSLPRHPPLRKNPLSVQNPTPPHSSGTTLHQLIPLSYIFESPLPPSSSLTYNSFCNFSKPRLMPCPWLAHHLLLMLMLFFFLINLFIYFWLCWIIVAACELPLVVLSGGYSSLWCAGFSLRWLLLLRSMGSRCTGLSSCGAWAQ